ncbi:hypothetical protein GH714_019806 [Hevea brasiliensis]|uniref:Pentacotripeptide-repeat region of PRORP domain-containing protein n=1 Tax=Hevea brasiliensis TaxID=3981 RepID=A0A6A6LSZ7_HEVBR|nr:hypothetical protein GH714_019806 [Hevea brasiliensis]
MFDNAYKVFDEMPERNCKRTVLSFNALLAACVNSKKYDKVNELFRNLPQKLEIQPDLVSYNTVIKAFCEMGSLDSGISLLIEIEMKGVQPDLITFNTLLNGFYANGRFVDGERLWSQMVQKKICPDIWSYNAKLLGFALEKRTKDAVELVEEMKDKGIKPSTISFNALIKGFVKEKNLEEAKRWYCEIGNSDCKPDKFTFATLIPFVCEKDDLGFAFELSKVIISRKLFVDKALLQRVVDGLLKESKIQEAKELAQLGNDNSYCRYNPTYGSLQTLDLLALFHLCVSERCWVKWKLPEAGKSKCNIDAACFNLENLSKFGSVLCNDEAGFVCAISGFAHGHHIP